MVVQLLSGDILLEIHDLHCHLLHGDLLQLLGEGRLGVHILRCDGLVARLFDSLLVRCAVFLRQRDVVGTIVLLGGSDDIGLRHLFDTLHLVEHVLPRLALREDHHQYLGTTVNRLQLLLSLHHQLALQGFELLVAEVAVHDLLQLFHDTLLSGLHLTQQFGYDDDTCTGGIVEAHAFGTSHHQLMLVHQ